MMATIKLIFFFLKARRRTCGKQPTGREQWAESGRKRNAKKEAAKLFDVTLPTFFYGLCVCVSCEWLLCCVFLFCTGSEIVSMRWLKFLVLIRNPLTQFNMVVFWDIQLFCTWATNVFKSSFLSNFPLRRNALRNFTRIHFHSSSWRDTQCPLCMYAIIRLQYCKKSVHTVKQAPTHTHTSKQAGQ